jgi:serine/threonine-protein kinase HipA
MPWQHVRVVEVLAWGERVGAIAATGARGAYTFEYEPAWKRRGLDLAP